MNKKYIDYVIVVHGIGDQKPNETVLPVINRFAEIRHDKHHTSDKQVVTLGMVTSQSGKPQRVGNVVSFGGCKPWSEFNYIPSNIDTKNNDPLPPFYGEISQSGENIRFVDLFWADIMQAHFEDVGQPVKRWSESLTGRLERKIQKEGADEGTAWVLPILYYLEETFALLQTTVFLKIPFVSEKIFSDYLGDIQLYGEYDAVRGQAVRRMHLLFEKIELHHRQDFGLSDSFWHKETETFIEPRYTIISHSLGTVMTLEALIYGHWDGLQANIPNLPFRGYEHPEIQQERPYCDWISRVDSLVTIGSPLDKFLIIWWNNYKYLNYPEAFKERLQKIRVYNYCDEQDPVGHALDVVSQKAVFQKLFTIKEDLIYNRYIVPGTAHTAYWDDIQLFGRILHRTIDATPFKEDELKPLDIDIDQAFKICKKEVYAKVLFATYFAVPIGGIALLTMTFVFAFFMDNFPVKALITGVLVIETYLIFRLIKLMVWWRQILRAKHKIVRVVVEGQEGITKIFIWVFRGILAVHTLASILYIPGYLEYGETHNTLYVPHEELLQVGFIALITSIGVYMRFRSIKRIQIPEYSFRWTLYYILGLSTIILGMFFIHWTPLLTILGEPSVFFSAYCFIASIVWVYSYLCYISARHVMQNR